MGLGRGRPHLGEHGPHGAVVGDPLLVSAATSTLDDIEAGVGDRVFLDGTAPPACRPHTAGDFGRRFDPDAVMALQEAINRARLRVRAAQLAALFAQRAVIDADASIVPPTGPASRAWTSPTTARGATRRWW